MFPAARSLIFSSFRGMRNMRKLPTNSTMKASHVKTSEEFMERVVNSQRPTVLMITDKIKSKTEKRRRKRELRIETIVAATEGMVDLVKVDKSHGLGNKHGVEFSELGHTINMYVGVGWKWKVYAAPVVYIIEHGKILGGGIGILDEKEVADLMKKMRRRTIQE